MPYRLSRLAERDLVDLQTYVAAEAGDERADLVIDTIIDVLSMLAKHPRAGRLRGEFGKGVRSFPVANHLIYYRATDGLLVARVLHCRRDQSAARRVARDDD